MPAVSIRLKRFEKSVPPADQTGETGTHIMSDRNQTPHPPFQPEQHQISAKSLKQKLDDGHPLSLIDVREPFEYQIVNLAGASLIPLNTLPNCLGQIDANREIVVYCHHGIRSMHAAYFLYENGFPNVKSLAGGIDQWAIEIDPTVRRY